MGGGNSKTQRAKSLRAAIDARLGNRVQVADVVAPSGSDIVLVHIRLPEMPESDLLALQEWVQTELWALEAERTDGLVLAPRYI